MFCYARFEIRTAFLQTFLRGDAVWLGEQLPTFRKIVVHPSSRSGIQRRVYFSRKILLCLHQRRDGQDMEHVYLKKRNNLHRLGRLNANTATSAEYTRKLYYKF